MERIAIIAWGACADVLYATPIVRAIRQNNKNPHITWLIRDKFAEVVETNPDVDEVKPFTLPIGHESRQEAEHVMDKQILNFAKNSQLFDKVYDLQYWPRYSNFYEDPSEDFISLRSRNAGLNPVMVANRKIILGVTDEDELAADDFVREKFGRHIGSPFITVNHISYAADPVWSFGNYEQLVDTLDHEYGVLSVFTGAPNEPIPEHAIDARGMPYRVWAAVIAKSGLWLGLDSGAVALACATDVPIIKLHSPGFPLGKTGIKAMGLRDKEAMELCPAPSVDSLGNMIVGFMNK